VSGLGRFIRLRWGFYRIRYSSAFKNAFHNLIPTQVDLYLDNRTSAQGRYRAARNWVIYFGSGCFFVVASESAVRCPLSHRLLDLLLVELICMSGKNLRAVPAGQRTNAEGKQVLNKVLLATPQNEFELMRADLTYLDLPSHLSLHEPTKKIEFVYFPNRGMVSQVVVTKDGRTVEVGVVGNEGYVGAGLATGLTRSSVREVIQIAGDGFRMMGNAIERILRSAPQLQMILSRHTGLQAMQVAQTAACNRLHDIQQRLSRWLLMTQDRVGSGMLPITHDFIATMMGTDRSTVGLAALVMQKKGVIDYVRGAVKVVSRRKLEKSACECYDVIQEFEDELGLR
jgi:CRP-like cAMP-binding protein